MTYAHAVIAGQPCSASPTDALTVGHAMALSFSVTGKARRMRMGRRLAPAS